MTTPDPLALVGLAHPLATEGGHRPGPADRSDYHDALAHGFDLAEALVLAEAVGDEARASRLAGELAALNAAHRRPMAPGPTGRLLSRALEHAGAYGIPGRHAGRLEGSIPGAGQAAADLGLATGPLEQPRTVEVTGGDRWHLLKVWPPYWTSVATGAKPFELRRDDRAYRVGDVLLLAEWEPAAAKFTGRSVAARVTYLATAAELAAHGLPYLADGIVVLGLSRRHVDLAEAPAGLRPV